MATKPVTLPLVTVTSPATKPVTAWPKVQRKTGLVLIEVAAGSGAMASATSDGSKFTVALASGESLPARSRAAPTARLRVTLPAAIGVTSWL